MSLQNRNGAGNLVVVLAFCFSSLRTTSIGNEYGPNSPRGRPASASRSRANLGIKLESTDRPCRRKSRLAFEQIVRKLKAEQGVRGQDQLSRSAHRRPSAVLVASQQRRDRISGA